MSSFLIKMFGNGKSHPESTKKHEGLHLKGYTKLEKSESQKKHEGLPKGCIRVYVGKEQKPYQVPLKYLSYPTFQELINKSQPNVLDAKIQGPLVLACKTNTFDQLMKIFKEY